MNIKNQDIRDGAKGRGVAVDSLFLAAVKVMTMLVGIASTMILARSLSLESYGTYAQGNLIITIATSLTVLGLTDASNYFFNRGGGSKYITNILGIQLVLGVAAAVIIIVGRDALAGYFDNPLVEGIVLYIALRPFLNNLLAALQVLMVSFGLARFLAIRNVIVSVVKIAVVSIVAIFTKDIATVFIAYLLVDIVNAVWFFAVYVNKCGFPSFADLNLGLSREILSFSIPMALAVLLSSLSREMSRLVTGAFESTANYAIFANCSAQLPLDFIAASFLTVLMPILTRAIVAKDGLSARSMYSNFIQLGYYLVWPIAGCLILLCEEAVLFLYGESYVEGAPVFALFIVTYGSTFLGSTLVLVASKKTKTLMVVSAVAMAINALGCVLLHSLFGFIGPAVASVAVNLCMSIAIFVLSCRAIEGKITEILNLKLLVTILGELLALGIVLGFVRYYLYECGVFWLIVAAIIACLYLGIFFLINRRKLLSLLRDVNRVGSLS